LTIAKTACYTVGIVSDKNVSAKGNTVKMDTHTHTSGVSLCSGAQVDLLAKAFARKGLDRFVLTNHYTTRPVQGYASLDAQAAHFCQEYTLARAEGKKAGVAVLFGVEVALDTFDGGYAEYLLFGITPQFLQTYPDIAQLNQEHLYKLCNDNGILMYQAHPFRIQHGQYPQNPYYIDGVEINRHPSFSDNIKKVLEFADHYNLGVTCGSDLHHFNQVGSDGIFVTEDVKTEKALVKFLLKNKMPKIFMDHTIKVQL